MAETRPANDDLAAVVAELRRDLADLRSTALARASRSPTGDIEPTIRSTPKPDTLLLQGQTVNRADYPVLWQWVQDQALTVPGLFGTGNGSTTFVLPDFRGRVPVGVGVLDGIDYALGDRDGQAVRTISWDQMPRHSHGNASHGHSTGADDRSHTHGFGTSSDGNHPSHAGRYVPGGGNDGSGAQWWDVFDARTHGAHTHGGGTGIASGPHYHSVNGNTINIYESGSSDGFDVRQPTLAINWLVWC